ncbi:MAG TPA: DUF2834 domain-containing protein [Paracoccus sp. (in: a-proteobacteria)]|nr:DUF2834 domain-containing protein [Paracoccus sp. (in: a-proteobacteria)]
MRPCRCRATIFTGWSGAPADLTPLRLVWLILTVTGAGISIWNGLPAPAGPDWAAVLTLAVWCLVETMVRRNWLALVTLPALGLGLGCALPLYLFIRSRRVV